MGWILYDHIDHRDRNRVKEWCENLQPDVLGRMNSKIDTLGKVGHTFAPGLGPLPGFPHLYKLKVTGKVAARLVFCKGPINLDDEYTLLMGEFERDFKLPKDFLQVCESIRITISHDQKRRRIHERARK